MFLSVNGQKCSLSAARKPLFTRSAFSLPHTALMTVCIILLAE